MDTDYQLLPDGGFVIRDYNRKKPFSNFLPGIAGLTGTPMWAFYVNRGQGMASFGTNSKGSAILEFFPANKAYQNVTSLGFRTFVKGVGPRPFVHEPFRENGAEQALTIHSHEFSVRERHPALGLEITARYFTVPDEPLAALARELSVKNLSGKTVELEILDGLPQVQPFGMNEFFIKQMSRTIEAWMTTDNTERKAPYFRLKVDACDRPEVTPIEQGNFYFALAGDDPRGRLAEMLVDPQQVFGSLLDFSQAKRFYEVTPFRSPAPPMTENKTPCAFAFLALKLKPGQTRGLRAYCGHARSLAELNRFAARASRRGYFDQKRASNRALTEGLKSPVFTATAVPAYDLYCGQTYLDNALRGGIPVFFNRQDRLGPFYAYSRKHGDLERDYNQFVVEPTLYSQGNGNYRDVNQNRRSDVWFDPQVKTANIATFLNLIQLDGFNPLVIRGAQFHFLRSKRSIEALGRYFRGKNAADVLAFLKRPFTPGALCTFLNDRRLLSGRRLERLFADMAPFLRHEERADHSEGFWVDHWTYNLDLIDSYLAVYPEDLKGLLFDRREFVFYDNAHAVRPRHERYVIRDGQVRQYGSVRVDSGKAGLIDGRASQPNLVRAHHGKGAVYRTTLFVKLLSLVTNKLASLDPSGIGVEMEADKPGWFDALNGLPGLLGSSTPESYELKRLTLFLIQAIDESALDPGRTVAVPEEIARFLRRLAALLEPHLRGAPRNAEEERNRVFWDQASAAKEEYRARTLFGVSGREAKLGIPEIKAFLEHAREKIEMGLDRAKAPSGVPITYFEHRVIRFKKTRAGAVWPLAFEAVPLPLFLEGPVHALKVERDPARRLELVKRVRTSGLYDRRLGMYKVTDNLSPASLEIGRARIFARGWLEHESIWLHMEYKFMLEMLNGGLIDEFFDDFRRALVPFQEPGRYGRNIIENVSFIVPSVFKDPALRGSGHIARLSGSTAEFLTIWLHMNVGRRPFTIGPDGRLSLRFSPRLPEFLFTKEDSTRLYAGPDGEVRVKVPKDSVAFMFLGKTVVCYRNPKRLDTFGRTRVSVKRIVLRGPKGDTEFRGDTVPHPHSLKVREGKVQRIDIELG
ncbi:MAG: hypothetical protein A3D28_03045 [Omnitrophica bacterium RIFCSPHIGHO2_02_FULL_63_14]|nr:MAG: hypothetical protein A3D28_03045 [Omnitrophica bacterium RIFCSPHIGHO2_02_FULL_63_14]